MAIEIVSYTPQYKEDFFKINCEWLEDMFEVEPYDHEVLSDPEKYILSEGGNIWFALDSSQKALGTCALMPHPDDHFELTKMGVLKSARGTGAGNILLEHVLKESKKFKPKSIFLLTNKRCKAAIHLYYKFGFVEEDSVRKKYGSSYKRCDFGMVYTHTS